MTQPIIARRILELTELGIELRAAVIALLEHPANADGPADETAAATLETLMENLRDVEESIHDTHAMLYQHAHNTGTIQ